MAPTSSIQIKSMAKKAIEKYKNNISTFNEFRQTQKKCGVERIQFFNGLIPNVFCGRRNRKEGL